MGVGQIDDDIRALEDDTPEKAQGLQGLVASRGGQVPLAQEVEQETLQIGGVELFGGGPGMAGECDGPVQIGFAGAHGKGAQLHGVQQLLA